MNIQSLCIFSLLWAVVLHQLSLSLAPHTYTVFFVNGSSVHVLYITRNSKLEYLKKLVMLYEICVKVVSCLLFRLKIQ